MAAASLMTLVSGLSGCTLVHNGYEGLRSNGGWNEAVVVMRNRSFSNKAWHRRKHHFCREKHLADYKLGFRQGYEDAASGGGQCTPAFPPQRYWGWDYQSAEGQARTAAWFAGYPQGARAAEEDGVGNWNPLQMSTGLQAEYANAGQPLYPIANGNAAEPITGTVIETPGNQAIQTLDGAILAPAPDAPGLGGFEAGMPVTTPLPQ